MDVELKIRRAEAIPLSERLYELGYDVAYVDVPCGRNPATVMVANCASEDLELQVKRILTEMRAI